MVVTSRVTHSVTKLKLPETAVIYIKAIRPKLDFSFVIGPKIKRSVNS